MSVFKGLPFTNATADIFKANKFTLWYKKISRGLLYKGARLQSVKLILNKLNEETKHIYKCSF
jgi:hypothetical protein